MWWVTDFVIPIKHTTCKRSCKKGGKVANHKGNK
jgi:hypothetical protein